MKMNEDEIPEVDLVRPLTNAETKLLELFDDYRKNSLHFLDEAGKQLVTLITALYGVFFAAFSFSDAAEHFKNNGAVKYVIMCVILFYFASLIMAALVFFPRKYKYSEQNLGEMRERMDQMLKAKRGYASGAYATFIIGTFMFVIALVIVLARL
jgi:hypothetical protein